MLVFLNNFRIGLLDMEKNIRLDNVQFLRGLAAMMIVIIHSSDQIRNKPIAGMAAPNLMGGTIWGSGIDIFFIISGFIMIYINHDKFGIKNYPITFFFRRLQRVAPTYWLLTLGMIAASLMPSAGVRNGLGSQWHIWSSFLFIPSPREDGIMHPVLGLGWTLNYEFFFYTCFAVALRARAKVGLACLAFAFVAGVAAHRWMPAGPLAFWTDPIILEFLLGISIGLMLINGVTINKFTGLFLVIFGFVLMHILTVSFPSCDRIIIKGIPSFIIVASTVLSPQVRWFKILIFIGDASYALYLSHPFSLNITTTFWKISHAPLIAGAYLPSMFFTALLIGLAFYYLVERNIQKLFKMGRLSAVMNQQRSPKD